MLNLWRTSAGGWRGGTAVKSACCSSEGFNSISAPSQGDSPMPVALAPGSQIPSSGLKRCLFLHKLSLFVWLKMVFKILVSRRHFHTCISLPSTHLLPSLSSLSLLPLVPAILCVFKVWVPHMRGNTRSVSSCLTSLAPPSCQSTPLSWSCPSLLSCHR